MRTKAEDRIGQKFGKLTIVKILDERDKHGNKMCEAICDCGNTGEWTLTWITGGNTNSCGCIPKKVQYKDSQAIYKAYDRYKRDAERRGYTFELSYEEFKHVAQGVCHYCGIEPQIKEYKRKGVVIEVYKFNGIDRKNNDVGYNLENALPCCSICNQAKHTIHYDDFKDWIERLVMFNGY